MKTASKQEDLTGMAGKDYNGDSDEFDDIINSSDPGVDEPEFDESPDDGEFESDFEDADLDDSYYDDTDFAEEVIEDAEAEELEDEDFRCFDETDPGEPFPDDDDYIYDEEGHSEPTSTIYYYKDNENYEEEMLYEEPEDEGEVTEGKKTMSLLKKILIGVGIFVGLLVLFVLFIVFTPAGRRLGLGCVATYLREHMGGSATDGIVFGDSVEINNGEFDKSFAGSELISNLPVKENGPRSEDYVTTFLAFGIEEIGGAANTDAILLVSVNKKDNTIKLTSLMRDTYVDIPGDYPNKINSVYSRGMKMIDNPSLKKAAGAALLMNVIENTYDVDISGYACVNFSSFEKIVDRLGGIDLELGEKEAAYLRKTNYISNPANRTVQTGWNHMNGNQVLGYCRVRKVATLGGANNDYGRTVRHRRVINAIISKFKSQSIFDMLPIMSDCLGYIFTNLTDQQIEDALVDIVENSIFNTASMRLPADEFFTDSGRKGIYNGKSNITYALVLGDQLGKNIEKFHQFLFLDSEGQTDTTGMVGAGAGVQFGTGGSSSGSSSSAKPTPTPVPTPALVDESIPATVQSGAGSSAETTPDVMIPGYDGMSNSGNVTNPGGTTAPENGSNPDVTTGLGTDPNHSGISEAESGMGPDGTDNAENLSGTDVTTGQNTGTGLDGENGVDAHAGQDEQLSDEGVQAGDKELNERKDTTIAEQGDAARATEQSPDSSDDKTAQQNPDKTTEKPDSDTEIIPVG